MITPGLPHVVTGGVDLGRPARSHSRQAGFTAAGYNERRVSLIPFVLFLCLTIATSFATIPVTCWDAASEFNDSANPDAGNPSGVWSYGWKKTLTDKFYLATTPYTDPPDLFGWSSASGYPLICHISRSVPVLTHGANRAIFPPHALSMHPGPNGEYAVIRFTASAGGAYRVSGQFFALDDNGTGTTTDVWLLKDNQKADAFSGKIDYFGGAKSASFTSATFSLKKGSTLDFQVGYGTNKNYEYDSTGLIALIQKIK
jgi:hypothetical protein